MAVALDAVGDRCSLLRVRELLTGPKRYVDLQSALPGIANNLLTLRLKELESSGILTKAQLPPPAARQVYVLTELGEQLEPILEALALWGVRVMGTPRPGDHFSLESPLIVLRALLSRDAPDAGAADLVLAVGGALFVVQPGETAWLARVSRGPALPAVFIPLPVLAQIAAGSLTWQLAVQSASVTAPDGNPLQPELSARLLTAMRNRS